MQRKSSDYRSPENLYLLAALGLFLILPFQNCSLSPVDTAWADGDPSFRVELPKPKPEASGALNKRALASQSHPVRAHRTK